MKERAMQSKVYSYEPYEGRNLLAREGREREGEGGRRENSKGSS